MRTLVISDIHGNLPALTAVLSVPHDRVVCLGDIVGYGPEPAACVELVRSTASLVIQGNHDRAHGKGISPRCSARFRWLAEATAPLADAQLTDHHRAYLAALPRWAVPHLGASRCLLVHATPRDPLYEYVGPDTGRWRHELAGIGAAVVFAGHTHVQFDLQVGATRVVNPGSVGQPKDGAPGAAYALVDGESITLGRAAYPIESAIERVERAPGVPRDARAALTSLLRTARVPAGPLGPRTCGDPSEPDAPAPGRPA